MEVYLQSVKAKSQTGNMSQIYNDNIKTSKQQDIPLRILKIYAFHWKLQQRASAPEESTAGVT